MASTMRDVAALAGVSPRTVSNVVRGYVHVSPTTRSRVQSAIAQLKYRPNVSAQSLRNNRTGIIALAVPEIAAPYFAEISDFIQRFAAQRDVTLLIDQTGADRGHELRVLEGYGSHMIDGLIMSPMSITLDDIMDQQLEIPVVLLGERISQAPLLQVAIDNVAAARDATQHLLSAGRTRIAAVGAEAVTSNSGPAQARLRGYRSALAEADMPPAPDLEIVTQGWSPHDGYAAVDRFLHARTRVDAMFCFNDSLALAALRAIRDHGLQVPDDIAVVGWDDTVDSTYSWPSLTTISPDKRALAQAAVDGLMTLIAGQSLDATDVVCGYELVVRESTLGVGATPLMQVPRQDS